MTQLQHTIACDATVTGKGLHTGKHVTVTFHPAPTNHGMALCVGLAGIDHQPDTVGGAPIDELGSHFLAGPSTVMAVLSTT